MGRKAIKKKRKDNPEKRRKWIVKLYPYFRENGLKDLKMDKMASLLGISKSTVYEYFSTKEEIVAETLAYKLEALMGFEAIIMNKTQSLEDRYQQLMDYMIPVLTDISSLLMDDLKSMFPTLWERVDAFYEHASHVLELYYIEGMKSGTFRNIRPALLSLSDRFFFKELVDPKFLKANNLRPEEAFQEYFELKFKGLVKAG